MIGSKLALVLLVGGGLVLPACKKDNAESPAASASASASAAPTATATASATATATAADTASAAPTDSASAVPTDAPPVVNTTPQRPIDDCCVALAVVATRRRSQNHKRKADAFKAAEICPGIAALVRQGRATRSQALTQIRSAMAGEPSPSACQ